MRVFLDKSLIFFFINFCFFYLYASQQKTITKIVAEISEYSRKDGLVKFKNNVKIELKNGKILCDKAIYDEKNKIVKCESNIYVIIISTKDLSSIEIFCNFAEYRYREMELEFYGTPYIVHKSSDLSQQNELKAEKFLLKEKENKIYGINDVHARNLDGEIFCDIAEYFIQEKIIYMNYNITMPNYKKVIFNSKKDGLNIKTFSSRRAIFDIHRNIFQLNGDVEVIFKSNDNT